MGNSNNPRLMAGTVIFYTSNGNFGYIRPDGTPPESIDEENRSRHDRRFSIDDERGFVMTKTEVRFNNVSTGTWPQRFGGDRVVFLPGRDGRSILHWGFEVTHQRYLEQLEHRPLIRAVEFKCKESDKRGRCRKLWTGRDLNDFRRNWPRNGRDDKFEVKTRPDGLRVFARYLEVRDEGGEWQRIDLNTEALMLKADPNSDKRWEVSPSHEVYIEEACEEPEEVEQAA